MSLPLVQRIFFLFLWLKKIEIMSRFSKSQSSLLKNSVLMNSSLFLYDKNMKEKVKRQMCTKIKGNTFLKDDKSL